MAKDRNQVFMCMSCGNCKRSDGENGTSFTFKCKCGDFIIDAPFAAKIEFIGCRSWIPSSDNVYEPFLIKLDLKHKTIEIGKCGKLFEELDEDDFSALSDAICNAYGEGNYSAVEDACTEAYGE